MIEELQDESKPGVPAGYDYGLAKLISSGKKISKQIKGDIKILKETAEMMEEL